MAVTITNSGSAGSGFKKYVDADGNLFINDGIVEISLNDSTLQTIHTTSTEGVSQNIGAVGDMKDIE